jgi:RNA 2',3'-cyclic 3'-phosphodiesterase
VRLFLAIDPPDRLREAVFRYAEALPGPIRRVPLDQLHLTLRFLGEVEEERVPGLVSALAAAVPGPPIGLRVVGGGAFPSAGRPRVLWAGIGGDVRSVEALAARIEDAVTSTGLPRADHPFRPHLTIARTRGGRVPEAVAAMQALPDLGKWRVDEVLLVRSTLGERAVHERVAAFRVAGPARAASEAAGLPER